MLERVQMAIDVTIHQGLRKKKLRSRTTAFGLVVQNLRDTGFFENSLNMFADMALAYRQRLNELQDQEKQFWTIQHRAPNHPARTIALRFARSFARQTGKRPTFGTSNLGEHPSTDFGRALEEVFEMLGIRANLRETATWAIDQLTEPDWMLPNSGWPVFGAVRLNGDKAMSELEASMLPKGM